MLASMTSTILANGRIVDGSGQAPFVGHIRFEHGEITDLVRAGTRPLSADTKTFSASR